MTSSVSAQADAEDKVEAVKEKVKEAKAKATVKKILEGAKKVLTKKGEKSEDKKTENKEEKKAAPKPKKVKKPAIPIFRMYDGTRISGDPKLAVLEIKTLYGVLKVPRSDLVRIRFARLKDPGLDTKIEAEIEKLKSEEFEIREKATENLRQFGIDALKLLKKATKSDDEEVKSRSEKLIKEIEEENEGQEISDDEAENPISGQDDEVVTTAFTIKGKIVSSEFEIASKYGKLQAHRKSIISIVFQPHSLHQAEFDFPATHLAPQNNWFASKVEVTKGSPLVIEASGTIQLVNYGWSAGPGGTRNLGGNHFKNFPPASLVAKIGKKGEPFLVGPKFSGKAKGSGKIYFALAYRSGQVSGSFKVKVKAEPQEEE